jgi:hypothetical protein
MAKKIDYQIGALWMEGRLSFLEQLCLKSFVDAGHHVVLYHYGPLFGVPDGIELKDANAVLPRTNFLKHERTGSPALHSDLFRYKMLEQNDCMTWADTDAYCVKTFETPNGHFYGWESEKHINGGVLGLPKDSDTLRELLEYTTDEFAIPSWYGPEYERELEEKKAAGNPVHASEQPWGVWGPHAVTHFLHKTGEAKYALPQEGLYPFLYKDRRNMLKRNFDTTGIITDNTYSIHLYGRRMRARLVEKEGGKPHPKSVLGKLLTKHNIDPDASPIPPKIKPVEAVIAAPESKPEKIKAPAIVTATGRVKTAIPNLTDLADKFGSDKGSSKHRYTELYHMLFQPFVTRKINFLEMGLQIGGPEHGNSEDRQTTDCPSIRMWLEYFPKAKIHGLDVSDFSWFKDDRFEFFRCDMDDRNAISNTADTLPPMDIIIDDASHASHHQQNAFLELFPSLNPGGLYIIEDLRWQPEPYEKKGITKTAELFSGFSNSRQFIHSDPEIAAEFNALAPHISGCFMFQAQYNKHKRDQVAVIHKV